LYVAGSDKSKLAIVLPAALAGKLAAILTIPVLTMMVHQLPLI
jgi:hypothetical protein